MNPSFRSTFLSSLAVVLALVLSLVVLGCSGSGSAGSTSGQDGITAAGDLPVGTATTVELATSTTADFTTTSGASSAGASTPSTETSSESVTPDGLIKACGFITNVWSQDGVHKLTIDYCDYLTGAAADAAAIEDDVLDPGGHMGGPYIRNHYSKLRTFTVSSSAAITTWWAAVQWPHPSPAVADPPCLWSQFYGYWHPSGSLTPDEVARAGGLSSAYWWIERDGPAIVKIEQVH